MFKKILIANRGEIALRIIRAAKELGISVVSVYSTADDLSLHKKFGDEAICIGPPDPRKSYLNMASVLAAAELTNSDAIHPGYGFLSENPDFSTICSQNNITFIGPDAETIHSMGHKSIAKKTMESFGVPVIPGSKGVVGSVQDGLEIASDIGYPVIIKAASGGGGRGMRMVVKDSDFENAYNSAQSESKISFDNDEVYIEKYFKSPRHIEVQILSDQHGNVFAFGERECSIQRRHQKVIEEAPSVAINEETRKKLCDTAVLAAKSVNYVGAGTIEFLYDENSNEFYFMEMNTRIQVEHPVTEFVTGVDLVKNQILSHAGLALPKFYNNLKLRGHSIECRINAEDPNKNFMPCPGTITSVHFPAGHGIRVDSAVYTGYTIPPNYDSMIAKIIVHAQTRREAISKMNMALNECVIEGVKTNIEFQKKILKNDAFIKGDINTNFLNNFH
ncbi:MAG: acetyl-CoA carboxylase biotin carboxylase subunit [Candidatus Marinimicrobia bacterium]|nr:acetyl-CoA carboxylase biotin carboxylase subunit [Candidatus Neomarinimicrobiota bacterium]|tara:strand:- start:14978 stop:16318 length:1341 start_codon:yes stop_codon:yes gene_type:complete